MVDTTTETRTHQRVVESSNIAQLAEALKVLGFGQVLSDLSASTEEQLTVTGSGANVTLSKIPVGPVLIGGNTTNNTWTQIDDADTAAAQEFKVNYATRVVTFGSGNSNGKLMDCTYLGLTKAEDGSNESELKQKLATVWGRS